MSNDLQRLYFRLLEGDYVVSSIDYIYRGAVRVGVCPGYYAQEFGAVDYEFYYLRPTE